MFFDGPCTVAKLGIDDKEELPLLPPHPAFFLPLLSPPTFGGVLGGAATKVADGWRVAPLAPPLTMHRHQEKRRNCVPYS